MITFAVYFYPLLHRDGTVQILQNLLVRIIYHGIVQRIQINKRSLFAAMSHSRADDSQWHATVTRGGGPAVARRIGGQGSGMPSSPPSRFSFRLW